MLDHALSGCQRSGFVAGLPHRNSINFLPFFKIKESLTAKAKPRFCKLLNFFWDALVLTTCVADLLLQQNISHALFRRYNVQTPDYYYLQGYGSTVRPQLFVGTYLAKIFKEIQIFQNLVDFFQLMFFRKVPTNTI